MKDDTPIQDIKPTGGPAFPNTSGWSCSPGMSLRDYIATQAMVALIPSYYDGGGDVVGSNSVAVRAYNMADAMLAESNK